MVGRFTAVIYHHPLHLIMVVSMSECAKIYAQRYEAQIVMHLTVVDIVTYGAHFSQCE